MNKKLLGLGFCLFFIAATSQAGNNFNILDGSSPPQVTLAPGTTIVITGNTSTNSSGTITAGGTAQVLFSGTIPVNGFKVAIPVALANLTSFVCFVSDTTTTPSATSAGSYPVYAGGSFVTEGGQKPIGAVYLNCPTTGTTFSAQRW